MKCLCCGKSLNTDKELKSLWHNSCISKFFSTKRLPELDLSTPSLENLVIASVNKGYTIPGVQKKLSLYLSNEDTPHLTLVDYPTGYILKPQTSEYAALPEAEYLVMQMAKLAGIHTVPFGLMQIKSDNTYAYITKRIDRIRKDNTKIEKLAMEDFCQLENRLTQDKYHSSYERCAKVIQAYSYISGFDMTELFVRIIFSFIIGNSDMHLKNFSLIETKPKSQEYHLSDAYDMLPVNIILPEDQEELALTLNGKKRNLRRNDFLKFAEVCGINKKSAEKMIDNLILKTDDFIHLCEESYLPKDMKENLKNLILKRKERLL